MPLLFRTTSCSDMLHMFSLRQCSAYSWWNIDRRTPNLALSMGIKITSRIQRSRMQHSSWLLQHAPPT